MTNSQEYTLHVLNELIVASFSNTERQAPRSEAGCDSNRAVAQQSDRRLELAERLRTEIAAMHGQAADNNSIVAAAFAAMRTNATGSNDDNLGDPLQRRIETALADGRLPASLREGLARFSGGARRHSATPT